MTALLPVVIVMLVAFGAFMVFLFLWTRRRFEPRTLAACSPGIDRWAQANNLAVTGKKARWYYYPHKCPFSFMWAGYVVRVTLVDAAGRPRIAWLRLDASPEVAAVIWDDDRRWGDKEDKQAKQL